MYNFIRPDLTWLALHPLAMPSDLGFLPEIIIDADERPVDEQLTDRYAHGGGFRPMKGFTMDEHGVLHYPEDRPYKPTLMTTVHAKGTRPQVVRFYPMGSLLSIAEADGTVAVTRVD